MKRLRGVMQSMGSVFQSSKSQNYFKLYGEKKYDDLIEKLKPLTAKQFLDIKEEDMTLLHVACMDEEGYEIVKTMASELPYF